MYFAEMFFPVLKRKGEGRYIFMYPGFAGLIIYHILCIINKALYIINKVDFKQISQAEPRCMNIHCTLIRSLSIPTNS